MIYLFPKCYRYIIMKRITANRLLAWGFPFDPSIRMRLMLDYYYYSSFASSPMPSFSLRINL